MAKKSKIGPTNGPYNGRLSNPKMQGMFSDNSKRTNNSYLNTGNYGSYAAPTVGGKAQKSTGMASGTTKKADIKKALKSIKKTAASPQAKAAARRAYKSRY